MGFLLTLIYIVLTIISPDQFGQAFASYHPMVFLAGITAVASFPCVLTNTYLRSSVQTKLLLGLIVAIVVSQVAHGLLGIAAMSLREILPVAAVFFFIAANVTTVRRLKILIWIIVGTCLSLTVETLCGYYGGFRGDMFVLLQYGQIRRLRAVGFLNDPNDLSQMLLIALSLIVVCWHRGRVILNSFIVLAPAALLLWAIYLTHSRGALIALAVLLLVVFHNKIGNIPSIVLAGMLGFGMMALDFTGGRGISAAEGADRLELWSEGLQLFKSAPVFGIGFGRFVDFSDLTAHNSFILCLAELGLVGSTIVVGLFVTTLMSLNNILNSQGRFDTSPDPLIDLKGEGQIVPCEWEQSSCEPHTATLTITDCEVVTEVEVDREEFVLKPFAVAIHLSLISFVTTSLFLSRSYTATMYLVLGLATATIGLEPNTIELGHRHRWVLVSFVVEVSAIILIYSAVRLRH